MLALLLFMLGCKDSSDVEVNLDSDTTEYDSADTDVSEDTSALIEDEDLGENPTGYVPPEHWEVIAYCTNSPYVAFIERYSWYQYSPEDIPEGDSAYQYDQQVVGGTHGQNNCVGVEDCAADRAYFLNLCRG
jgi:hypothetical protein